MQTLITILRFQKFQKTPCLFFVTIITIFLIAFDFHYSNVFISSPGRLHCGNTNLAIPGNNLVETQGCALPKTDFYPNGFIMKKHYGPNCDFEKRLVTIDDDNELLKLSADGEKALNENQSRCTVFEIKRRPSNDTFQNGQLLFNITTTKPLDISDKEIFATKCGPFINFDAHFPLTKNVQNKINSWKKLEIDKIQPQLPISVLLIGFDSVSRSHFHRSFPKTLPLLTQMGFIDFKGYHTIAPNTLDNFYAFLMGLTNPQVRNTCARFWYTPFDTCPVIWKDFAVNNYVTMYTEDGSQSFNWGGQGGFLKKPTDYYTHPMYGSVQDYRIKYSQQTKDDSCPSSINNPNYLLDYTKRFLQKFMKTPFFSLTWFANPFHENTYALYGLDEKMEAFFQFLNSDESIELRERTLIILNSDHGERSADFIRKGYKEGSIERSLPGLFIRLPDNLLKEYPELNLVHTLKDNSQRLTSGFDLHHTFLHLLKLSDLQILVENQNRNIIGEDHEFKPVLSDRSSLLLPVSDQRTCADLNIKNENCACAKSERQSSSNSKSQFQSNNALYFNVLVKFAVFELNSFVNRSKYRDVCEVHKKTVMSFVSWNVKEETDEFTLGFLRFVTYIQLSTKALFEVQLRVQHTKAVVDMEGITRVGSFNRLNRYGDLSWCVEFETDADKKMKELCHCNGREGTI